MLRKNISKTTIGIYVRSLRCIFNEAIEDGIIKRDRYPFGRRRYQVPTSRNIKKAITEKATRCDPKPITVFITEDMRAILDRWANKDRSPNNYVFPVLEPDITALRQYELIELFTQSINDWLVKIKRKLGIEKRLTTYVARHTFSTVLKRSGVSTEFIQESLGHTNIRTTEKYLDSFEKEVKRNLVGNLTAFKKNLPTEKCDSHKAG